MLMWWWCCKFVTCKAPSSTNYTRINFLQQVAHSPDRVWIHTKPATTESQHIPTYIHAQSTRDLRPCWFSFQQTRLVFLADTWYQPHILNIIINTSYNYNLIYRYSTSLETTRIILPLTGLIVLLVTFSLVHFHVSAKTIGGLGEGRGLTEVFCKFQGSSLPQLKDQIEPQINLSFVQHTFVKHHTQSCRCFVSGQTWSKVLWHQPCA